MKSSSTYTCSETEGELRSANSVEIAIIRFEILQEI